SSATPSTDQKANNDGPGREQETSSAVTTGTSAPSTDPSTDLPPPSTGVCSPSPLIPPKAGGTAKRAVEAPGRPPAFPEERSKGLGGSPPLPPPKPQASASEPRPPQSTNGGEMGVRHCDYCGQPGTAADPLQHGHWRPRRPEGDWLHAGCIGPMARARMA